jgi:hypothetical protein
MDNAANGETDEHLQTARTYLESRGVLAKTAAELHVQLVEHPSPDVLNNLLHFTPAPSRKRLL